MRKPLDLENGQPDKSVPCPRCHSFNTKFCYFNNYNVKQPRHFCRECQRYWTAGGSLRNVPIGAGRRKHKLASALSSKLHDSTEVRKLNNSDVDTYPSLPLQQHFTNGNILQEDHSLTGMQSNDVISVCGSNKAWPSQLFMNPARDVTENSNMSIISDGHMSTHCETHSSQQPSEILQYNARSSVVEAKATNVHEAHTSKRICHCADLDQNEVSSVEDVYGNNEPDLQQPLHISNIYESLPSATHSMPDPIYNLEYGESTTLASSASEAATALNGTLSVAHNLPAVSHPSGLESLPAFWAPLMWPWIWPFFANGPNAPNLAAGIGALAANVAAHAEEAVKSNHGSHINMTCLGPSFLHWPYAWNTLPWGSPWSRTWNASNLGGHGLSLQEPVKEKQGLLCTPKTLRMDNRDEAVYSSILKTLGVTALPQSGLHNTFQPKAEVFQPKFIAPKAVEHSELHRHPLPHLNPAAQARSVAFQEGS